MTEQTNETQASESEITFKEVTLSLPPKWGGENGPERGDVLTGRYVDRVAIKGQNGGAGYFCFVIEQKDGQRVGVTGAILEQGMDRVPVGSVVRITFNGVVKTKRPGQKAKDFKLELAAGVKLLPAKRPIGDPDAAHDADIPF